MGVLKDFDCKAVKKDRAVEGNHPWSLIQPGLAYCGLCRTNNCPAFKHVVVANRGRGDHLVNDDIISGAVRCPSCATPFQLEFIALYQCKAVVTLHAQVEETASYEASGDDLIKLGTRAGQGPVFEGALLSIKVVKERECVVS